MLADTFKVRIEMKQIGARQEAGRIGGIGPCGRPLCCSSWMTNFVSVATSAARYQDISLNPQKLAGQCAKLKCCLNFEVDVYVESAKFLPPRDVRLETADATYYHFKTDIFKREITYSTDKSFAANLVTIDARRAFEVIAMNKAGEKPLTLEAEEGAKPAENKAFGDILGQDDVARFDKKKKRRNKQKSQSQAANGNGADAAKTAGENRQEGADADGGGGENRRPERQKRRNDRRRRQGGAGDKSNRPEGGDTAAGGKNGSAS